MTHHYKASDFQEDDLVIIVNYVDNKGQKVNHPYLNKKGIVTNVDLPHQRVEVQIGMESEFFYPDLGEIVLLTPQTEILYGQKSTIPEGS